MSENRRLSRICVTIIATVALAGCGKGADTHAKIASDVAVQLQAASDAIATVNDKTSAEAAGKKITDAAEQIDKVAVRMKKLPKPTEQEDNAIRSEMKPKMEAITKQMQSSMIRLQGKADALTALQGPMARLQMSLMGMSTGGAPSTAPPAMN
jgi:hypothetical protein